jgi:N-acetylglutamate synthase-like GNAT family acetyltransferase
MSVEIAIIQNTMAFHKDFKRLNEAWISTYFQLEDSDIELLNYPQRYILDKGGVIFIALSEGKAVGTCALIVRNNSTCELAKLAVDPEFQNHGVGKLLCSTLKQKAKHLGFQHIILEGSTKMPASIALYHKLGFVEVEKEKVDINDSLHERCNILMQLDI